MKFNLIVKTLLLVIIIPLFSSCGNYDEIVIGEPKEVKIRGFEDNFIVVDVSLPINNPTIHRISIKEMDVRVFLNNKYIGKLSIDDKVRIKPKQNTVYELPVKIRLTNMLGAAFVMMNLKKGQASDVRFEGQVKARSLIFTKTVKIEETKKINF